MQTSSKRFWKPSLSPADPEPGCSVHFTPRFWLTLVMSALLYIFAAFLANEWLYFLACGLALAAILAALLPILQVLSIEADCCLPSESVGWQDAEMSVVLRLSPARARWLGASGAGFLTVTPLLSCKGPSGCREEFLDLPSSVVHVFAGECQLHFPLLNLRRGIYMCRALSVTSCFPFGLVFWSRSFKPHLTGGELLTVFPRSIPLAGNFLVDLGGISSAMGLSFSNRLASLQSTSVRSVREYQTGDSPRRIHWPSSARQGRLLVREFDCETLPVFDVLLDLKAAWRDREQFELACCVVQSLIHLGFDRDIPPDLILNPPMSSPYMSDLMSSLPPMRSASELLSEMLARVEPPQFFAVDPGQLGGDWQTAFRDCLFDRPILTVIPSAERIMKHSPGLGDHVVSPVLVAVLTSRAGTGSDSSAAATLAPRIMATISGDTELAAL